MRSPGVDTVEDIRDRLHRDPRGAAAAAAALVVQARADGDAILVSRGLAVLGRARRSLGEIDLAEADLRGALRVADGIPDAALGADARIGLAGVLTFTGRSAEAFDLLDEAERLGGERLGAYARLQRAVIDQRRGRLPAARASYDQALPVLRRLQAWVDVAMVLVNRGVVRTQTGDADGAVRDLTEAGELFAAQNDEFGVARAWHGLGWAHSRRGELPTALRHLDEAGELFRRLGHESLEVDVDRAEVLLSAGLHVAADQLAEHTTVRLVAAGNQSLAAEMSLLRARCALLDGDRPAAAKHAERASAMYAEQDALGWELVAALELLRCTDGPSADLQDLAERLDHLGNARDAALALGLAAEAACREGSLERATELAEECTRRATTLRLFEVRMQAAHARAVCAVARGELPAAGRHTRAALRELAGHRRTLTAGDARAAVAGHTLALSRLGLRLALAEGSPSAVLRAMELGRAGRGKQTDPLPPDDPDMAAELTRLRSVVALNRTEPSAELIAQQQELEQAIHRRVLRSTPSGTADPASSATIGRVRAAIGTGVLIELAEIAERLVAVVVDTTPARVLDLGSAADISAAAQTLHTTLRRSLSAAPSRDAVRLMHRCLDALDRMLTTAAAATAGSVVLIVPPDLHVVPWNLLPCLRGRGVTVAPSATWWLSMGIDPKPVGPPVLVAGPRLTQAAPEIEQIAAGYPGARVLTGDAAGTAAVLAAMGEAPLAHLACHGIIRRDNPLWSSLELADGPLYVYDLQRLDRTPPLVVLSGCETGVGIRAGDQLLGLTATLLEQGARQVIASTCPLPDTRATRDTMVALHAALGSGHPASRALAELTADPRTRVVAAALTCFGRG